MTLVKVANRNGESLYEPLRQIRTFSLPDGSFKVVLNTESSGITFETVAMEEDDLRDRIKDLSERPYIDLEFLVDGTDFHTIVTGGDFRKDLLGLRN